MSLESQVEELSKELIDLRKAILVMKALVKQQNSMLKDLAEMKPNPIQTVANLSPKLLDAFRFPIKTQEELDAIESYIDESTEPIIMQEVRLLVGVDGLTKNLPKILSSEIVLSYNYSGLHNKKRLQDYPKLLDALFKASKFSAHSRFLDDLRCGLKTMKQKHFKNVSLQRRRTYESILNSSEIKNPKRLKAENDE